MAATVTRWTASGVQLGGMRSRQGSGDAAVAHVRRSAARLSYMRRGLLSRCTPGPSMRPREAIMSSSASAPPRMYVRARHDGRDSLLRMTKAPVLWLRRAVTATARGRPSCAQAQSACGDGDRPGADAGALDSDETGVMVRCDTSDAKMTPRSSGLRGEAAPAPPVAVPPRPVGADAAFFEKNGCRVAARGTADSRCFRIGRGLPALTACWPTATSTCRCEPTRSADGGGDAGSGIRPGRGGDSSRSRPVCGGDFGRLVAAALLFVAVAALAVGGTDGRPLGCSVASLTVMEAAVVGADAGGVKKAGGGRDSVGVRGSSGWIW